MLYKGSRFTHCDLIVVVKMQVEFIKSRKGGDILCLNSYRLHLNYRRNGKIYWKCLHTGCKTTAISENGEVLSSKGTHSHPPEQRQIEVKKAVESAKQLAKENAFLPMKRAYRQAFQEVDLNNEEIMDEMPSFSKYKSSMYRARSSRLPPLPHTRAEVELNGEWTQTKDGRNFIISNDGDVDRLILFGTQQNLRFLCDADTIYMDGTFQIAPEMFQQVYSIHVMVMGAMIPVCICLLPFKNTETYIRMFNLLQTACQRHGLQFLPSAVFIDFESAVISAVSQLFPVARIRGCMFHYSQAIWRKVQNLGLTNRYRDDASFNRVVRRALALPLLPMHEIEDVWLTALNEIDNNDNLAIAFTDYITTTWVDPLIAQFPVEMWSHYETLHGIRTTNHLESWHNKVRRELDRAHPNVFRVIELFKEQQEDTEHTIRLLRAGGPAPKQRPKYRVITERLVRLKQRLQDGDISAYNYSSAIGGIMTFHF